MEKMYKLYLVFGPTEYTHSSTEHFIGYYDKLGDVCDALIVLDRNFTTPSAFHVVSPDFFSSVDIYVRPRGADPIALLCHLCDKLMLVPMREVN